MGFRDFFFSLQGNGWHLNRSRFDASLEERAVQKGAILRRGMRLVGSDRQDNGQWHLEFLDAEGTRSQLKATFAIDATGRRSAFACQQGASPVRIDGLLGIATVFELEKQARVDRYTLLEAAELGWWYAAHLPDNRAIVTLMSDRQLLRQHPFSRWENWKADLEKTRYVREMVAGATSISRLQIQPAISQYLDAMVGEGWLAVGDAACTFDPLSSAGIYKALTSGLWAAEATLGYLNGDQEALREYESRTRRQFELYLEDRRKYYSLERRWPLSPFWQPRRLQIGLSPSQKLWWERSPESDRQLKRLKMYLPRQELHLLCELCLGGKAASDVVGEFLARCDRLSAYRAIEALQYLLAQQILVGDRHKAGLKISR
ncbi:MAG: hypothetical protein F6K13_16825 [Okeania sp. SIO2B9]|nr:hypothetical protein [Okeania sp. SIO2B9]